MSATEDILWPATSPASLHRDVSVLLVDDQLMIGEAVRRALLGEADIDFRYCHDADEALRRALEIAPSVILQDIVMPGVNGLDLVRGYRAAPTIGRTPIIVLSTHDEPTIKRLLPPAPTTTSSSCPIVSS